MVETLVYESVNTGLRTPEIEEAHQAAWIAISVLSASLKVELFAPPDMWSAAFNATERWRGLLI
jgi:hypothetical protein